MNWRLNDNAISGSLLGFLILLRLLSGYWSVFFEFSYDIQDLILFVSFCLIFSFIWINRANLAYYHFDKLSILAILIFNPIRVLLLPLIAPSLNSLASFPNLLSWATIFLSIGMYWCLRPTLSSLPNPTKRSWIWIAIGGASGVILNLIFGFLLTSFTKVNTPILQFDYSVLLAFPYQIGYAAVYEEPIFRGILWGKTRQLFHNNSLWINIFQAIIFTLAHGLLVVNFLQSPGFATIFVGGILFGYLAWRSHSLATSMAAHAFYNAFGFFTTMIMQSLLIN